MLNRRLFYNPFEVLVASSSQSMLSIELILEQVIGDRISF